MERFAVVDGTRREEYMKGNLRAVGPVKGQEVDGNESLRELVREFILD